MMVNLGEKISVLVEKQLKEITKNKIHSSRNAKNYSLNQKSMDKIRHDIYPLGACVILGNSILNGILEENLSNELPVKVKRISWSHCRRLATPCPLNHLKETKVYNSTCRSKRCR